MTMQIISSYPQPRRSSLLCDWNGKRNIIQSCDEMIENRHVPVSDSCSSCTSSIISPLLSSAKNLNDDSHEHVDDNSHELSDNEDNFICNIENKLVDFEKKFTLIKKKFFDNDYMSTSNDTVNFDYQEKNNPSDYYSLESVASNNLKESPSYDQKSSIYFNCDRSNYDNNCLGSINFLCQDYYDTNQSETSNLVEHHLEEPCNELYPNDDTKLRKSSEQSHTSSILHSKILDTHKKNPDTIENTRKNFSNNQNTLRLDKLSETSNNYSDAPYYSSIPNFPEKKCEKHSIDETDNYYDEVYPKGVYKENPKFDFEFNCGSSLTQAECERSQFYSKRDDLLGTSNDYRNEVTYKYSKSNKVDEGENFLPSSVNVYSDKSSCLISESKEFSKTSKYRDCDIVEDSLTGFNHSNSSLKDKTLPVHYLEHKKLYDRFGNNFSSDLMKFNNITKASGINPHSEFKQKDIEIIYDDSTENKNIRDNMNLLQNGSEDEEECKVESEEDYGESVDEDDDDDGESVDQESEDDGESVNEEEENDEECQEVEESDINGSFGFKNEKHLKGYQSLIFETNPSSKDYNMNKTKSELDVLGKFPSSIHNNPFFMMDSNQIEKVTQDTDIGDEFDSHLTSNVLEPGSKEMFQFLNPIDSNKIGKRFDFSSLYPERKTYMNDNRNISDSTYVTKIDSGVNGKDDQVKLLINDYDNLKDRIMKVSDHPKLKNDEMCFDGASFKNLDRKMDVDSSFGSLYSNKSRTISTRDSSLYSSAMNSPFADQFDGFGAKNDIRSNLFCNDFEKNPRYNCGRSVSCTNKLKEFGNLNNYPLKLDRASVWYNEVESIKDKYPSHHNNCYLPYNIPDSKNLFQNGLEEIDSKYCATSDVKRCDRDNFCTNQSNGNFQNSQSISSFKGNKRDDQKIVLNNTMVNPCIDNQYYFNEIHNNYNLNSQKLIGFNTVPCHLLYPVMNFSNDSLARSLKISEFHHNYDESSKFDDKNSFFDKASQIFNEVLSSDPLMNTLIIGEERDKWNFTNINFPDSEKKYNDNSCKNYACYCSTEKKKKINWCCGV